MFPVPSPAQVSPAIFLRDQNECPSTDRASQQLSRHHKALSGVSLLNMKTRTNFVDDPLPPKAQKIYFIFLIVLVFVCCRRCCCLVVLRLSLALSPSAVARSWLTASCASQVQAILLPQPPDQPGLQVHAPPPAKLCITGRKLPRLECSGVISAHCKLGSSDSPAPGSQHDRLTQAQHCAIWYTWCIGLCLEVLLTPLLASPVSKGNVHEQTQRHLHNEQFCFNKQKPKCELNTHFSNETDFAEVIKLGDSRQRSHTGHQRDSWPARLFCRRLARRFPVRSVRDGRARLVPSPEGKQQAIGSAED
ncbi:putative uncharacterized protein SPANXA2-OT1 [Plecturocebus cupreus]